MFSILRKIYERKLEKFVSKGKIPAHLVIVTEYQDFTSNLSKFKEFVKWCEKFGIKTLTICLNTQKIKNPRSAPYLILNSFKLRNIKIISNDIKIRKHGEGPLINFLIGYNGKKEITDAVKRLAKLVEDDLIDPENIDEKIIEKYLCIKNPPDLIIKTGKEIPNFLIWQSIYSELHFLDIEWKSFRYTDFLRCLREYQKRERRYGK